MNNAVAQNEEQLASKSMSIFFDSDEAVVNTDDKQSIRSTILEIGSLNITEIYVEGHTDEDATNDYNIVLSAKRAGNTQDFLLSQGVKEKMIVLESFGESKPLSKVKAENRRVVITFVYKIPQIEIKGTRTLIIQSLDARTRKPLSTEYVYQKNELNIFGKTNQYAYCRIKSDFRDVRNIIFSKSGYLSSELSLNPNKYANRGDTIHIKVYLKPVKVVDKIRYNHIYFYTDTHKFKPESKQDLEKLLTYLNQHPNLAIEIQGHMNFPNNRTPTKMQRIYNHNLSHNRAKAVYNYLLRNGIDRSRLTYKGLSNTKMIHPMPANNVQADENKRVEVWALEILASKD